jgi:hypothetical protein
MENRRVGTRYDRLVTSFLAFVNLAIIRRYLKTRNPDEPLGRSWALHGASSLRLESQEG